MPDAVKGGLFVGAAVATGILVGLLVPSLFGPGRDTTNARAQSRPTMPGVVGQQLDEAERVLRRRAIDYETDAPGIVEAVVPDLLEVCESDPAPGRSIRGRAQLHVAFTGTCSL